MQVETIAQREQALRDRRAAQRLEMKARVRARLVDTATGTVAAAAACAGWTQDVSLGGIRFGARKALPVNGMVELDVACSRPAENYSLRGQVGWLCREGERGYSIGVFIREEDRERLVSWRRMLARRGLGA